MKKALLFVLGVILLAAVMWRWQFPAASRPRAEKVVALPLKGDAAGDAGGKAANGATATPPAATAPPAAVPPTLPGMSPVVSMPKEHQTALRNDPHAPPYTVKRVILSEEKPLDGQGRFQRTQLVETTMKHPFLRVEEEVLKAGHAGDEHILRRTAAVANHVIVEPHPGQSAQFEEWARRHHLSFMRRGPSSPIYLLSVGMASLEDLPKTLEALRKEQQTISTADPDYVVQASLTPNDSRLSNQWALHNTGQSGGTTDSDIDAPEAWNVVSPMGGDSVVIGIIDTGVDYDHPDLAANIWANTGEIAGNGLDDDNNGYVDDRRGWDFANNDNNPMDDHFHGTHVAGIIGAAGNNSQGVAGVVWNAKLMPLKFLGVSGGFTSDAIEAIDYATANGARLTNNSWGGGGSSQSLKNAIQRAQDAGVLFVAAAGNSGLNHDQQPSYPAAYPNDIILSVAATDHKDTLAAFSDYSTTCMDVAAPGVGIMSTFPTAATSSMTQAGLPTNYGSISGTSMAAPYATGLAALLWKQQPTLTAAQVKERIMSRGDAIPLLLAKVASGRRINAFSTVDTSAVSPAQLLFTSTTAAFTGGNADNVLNPGETLELTPAVFNNGGQTATAVSLEVATPTAGVFIIGSAAQSLGHVPSMGRIQSPAPFKLSIPPSMAENTRVDVQITARWGAGQQVTQTYSTVVVQSQPQAEVELTWAPGEPAADPGRERVYLLDRTNLRVLAVDATAGTVTAWAGVAGSPEVAPPVENGSLRTGMLAVSHSGSTLWVALPGAKKIQSFNLPALTPAATLDVSFNPVCLAQSANGRLFATSTDYWGPIRELNPATGAVIRSFDKGGTNGTYYMHSLLRLSADGLRLFAGETGLSSGGSGYLYEYVVSGTGAPSVAARHPYSQSYMKDFATDSARQRLYTVCGGIYGVQVTETGSGTYGTQWPFASAYGAAVELPQGSNVVYGASGDPYSGEITRFEATSGSALTRAVVGTEGFYLPSRALAVTSGGAQSFIKARWTGSSTQGVDGYRYFFGIVGRNSVDLSSLPPPVPTPTDLQLSSVDFSDPDANLDGIAAPGETVRLLPRFRNAGGLPATGISVTCSVATAGVSIQAPASLSMSDVAGFGSGAPASAFRVNIGAGVADGTSVDVTFSATFNGSQNATSTWRFVVRIVIPNSITAADYGALGQVLADRTRNVVYLQDRQLHRMLALDTSLGVAVASCPLEGPPKVNGAPPVLGGMAVSVDGSTLFVAIMGSKMIQAISLPQFQTAGAWTYSFAPDSLATDAQGRLYASADGAPLQQINGSTGAVKGTSNAGAGGLLRSNAAGTVLFSRYGSQIERFSTTGSGLPTLTGSTSTGTAYADDYAWDETRQRFVLPNSSTVKVVPVSGVVANWTAGASHVNSVQMSPADAQVWAGVSNPYIGVIRVFDAATGATVRDFNIETPSNHSLLNGGLAVTPNGRAVYVLENWVGSYTSSVDGSMYKVGLIGSGVVDLDLPLQNGKVFSLMSCVAEDPPPTPNNNDNYASPGETIHLTPTIKNQSLGAAGGVQVRLVSSSSKATVLTSGAVNAGQMSSYATFSPAAAFQLKISTTAVDGEELLVRFRVSRTGAADEYLEHRITVFKPETAHAVEVSYELGEIMADPSRNLVYAVDTTNARILAFNTETNTFSAVAPLAGAPGPGFMAVSADRSKLYVALNGAMKIQSFHLPELSQADIVDVNFPIHSIMLGADGFIYASSTVYWGKLHRVNALTGAVTTTFEDSVYKGSIVRGNSEHTRLFMVEQGLSGGGATTPEWDVTGTVPVLLDSHFFELSNTKDIQVDDAWRRLYFASGGVYGVGVTEMDTGLAGIEWLNEEGSPYGIGVSFLPHDQFVYGMSRDTITRYSRSSGKRLGYYEVSESSDLGDRGIALTPNGRIVFVIKPSDGNSSIGVMGGSPINTTLPTISPSSFAGNSVTLREDNSTTFSASVVNNGTAGALSHSWKVLEGPGAAVFSNVASLQTDASFSRPGRYLVEVTSSASSGKKGSDVIVVDVTTAPPLVSVSASKESAFLQNDIGGEFTFTRSRGDHAQALVVNFTRSGTATAGVHFQSFPSTITIPVGQNSARVVVTPTATSMPTPLSVNVTVSTNAAYELGPSRAASVSLKDGSYAAWKSERFNGQPPTAGDQTADPDLDGRSNLLEYALGTDPLGSNPGQPEKVTVEDGYLCITYDIPAGSLATYTVETSTDLAVWHSNAANVEEVSRVRNEDGTITVKARRIALISPGDPAFIRLKVE